MDFNEDFNNWLTTALAEDIPDDVAAFHFNLYESAGDEEIRFGIDLVGAGCFDPEDDDWACDEVWTPEQRMLYIPLEASGTEWEACLSRIKSLIQNYLNREQGPAEKLKSGTAVGIGFVDGDIELAWQR
ncbi:MAG: hypothetical protein ACIAZJ_28155 [Gimesia chilikensis]|uniref:hypothetical protein n=1 Tax=Gimesia chilikensis TaxID=2605989 RepID=UPI00379EC3D4